MKNNIKNHYILIASLLFGLFFGAGNLIFPVSLGQLAGSKIYQTNFGFLVTATGLPLLGIIAMALSNSDSVYTLANKVGTKFARGFTIILYLVIGPFFAVPRLATASFEVGIVPFIPNQDPTIYLVIYSILFFAITWLYARKPNQLLYIIGKILTPILIILLTILFIFTFVNPMGIMDKLPVQTAYQSQPFMLGFIDGYHTLDALAALAFGIIIINALHEFGITNKKEMTKDIIISGIIGIGMMAVIYSLLARMGALSLGQALKPHENGGGALVYIADYYMGILGQILLGVILSVACLKTSIGLLSAFSETFSDLFPSLSYQKILIVATILPTIFANFGLNAIISLSLPVLMIIYPIAIVLIFLAIIDSFLNLDKKVYQYAIIFASLASIFDAIKVIEYPLVADHPFIQSLLDFASTSLPLFDMSLAWCIPALVGAILGWLVSRQKASPNL